MLLQFHARAGVAQAVHVNLDLIVVAFLNGTTTLYDALVLVDDLIVEDEVLPDTRSVVRRRSRLAQVTRPDLPIL